MRKLLCAAFLASLAVLQLSSMAARGVDPQAAATTIDVDALGPKVGDTVPSFSLPDQHGTTRSLKSLMGPKGAILVFFRSADW